MCLPATVIEAVPVGVAVQSGIVNDGVADSAARIIN